jgi:hypothetical protein
MTSRHDDPEGPLANLSQAYFRGFDTLWKNCDPALMNLNSECVRLVNRRTKAWLEIPASLSRCKTPLDVFNEQLKFWQQMGQDYAEGNRQIATMLSSLQSMPGTDAVAKNINAMNAMLMAAMNSSTGRRAA